MRPVALLVAPPGTHRVEPLADAVQRFHPDWECAAVWAGDPHLRPSVQSPLRWYDVKGEAHPERQRQLVSMPVLDATWARAFCAAHLALEEGVPFVVVLMVGSVAVLGPLDALVPSQHSAVLVPRVHGALPDDELSPSEADLMIHGSFSTSVLGIASGASELLGWFEHQLAIGAVDGCVGRVFDRAALAFDVERCDDRAVGVSEWRWDVADPCLLDLPDFDPAEPWTLNKHRQRPARVDVAAVPRRMLTLQGASAQLEGSVGQLVAPGGIVIDRAVRSAVIEADDVVPAAWSDPKDFRAWLSDRYWSALREDRRDLATMFPEPRGRDGAGFRTWCRRAFVDDLVSAAIPVSSESPQRWTRNPVLEPHGVNVVGYLTKQLGLGDVARTLVSVLAAAGVPCSALPYDRSSSPTIAAENPLSRVIAHRSTVAVVAADQFSLLMSDHPELRGQLSRLIGYWFWELDQLTRPMLEATSMVDEIWVGSTFVAEAFRSATDIPVRHVPIPMGRPEAALDDARACGPLARFRDRVMVGVVFDHFSTSSRKNPLGAIEAFKRAFAPDEGPVLVVKSINAARRWPQHQRLIASAADRPDIVVWDEHLPRPDHLAFIRDVDILVSLHRSEGLGLHLMEAMWLGTPVIATRYSGNLDFMDDDTSVLIDVQMVPVEAGDGIYPPDARWADPDLDQAATALRTLAADPALRARLAAKARERMEQQPTPAETGRLIAELLGIDVAS